MPIEPTSLQPLQDEVTEISGVVDSAVALINGIAGRVQAAADAAKTDPNAVQALADQLKAESLSLASAVAANS
jgi:hypothetical protein